MIELSQKIIDLIQQARLLVVRTTNTAMIYTYFSVGKMIVDEWQQGKQKAAYGVQLLEKVSSDLTHTLGKGFSVDNLENMRKFYLVYMNQILISENTSRILENRLISETASRKLPVSFYRGVIMFSYQRWTTIWNGNFTKLSLCKTVGE